MAPILVRPAVEADVLGVVACLRAAFAPFESQYTPGALADTVPGADGLRERLASMRVLVAVDASGEVVGTIAYGMAAGEEAHVRGMAVRPRHQGGTVAQRLLAAVEAELRGRGCARITLDTTRPLVRAIAFYVRNGFTPSGKVSDFHGMPLFEYAKQLG